MKTSSIWWFIGVFACSCIYAEPPEAVPHMVGISMLAIGCFIYGAVFLRKDD